MTADASPCYPGDSSTPDEILELAHEYRRAAELLYHACRRGEPRSRAPFRLVALHATELYLNALLIAAGHPHTKLRRLHHDLAARADIALAAQLRLRKRTRAHLANLSATREYLVARYDPNGSDVSELNRVAATLAEVAQKAADMVIRPGGG